MTNDLNLPFPYGPDRPVRLNTLSLPDHRRVIVLGPHPDDFDAIGVTLRLFLDQGHFLAAAVLTSGASGVEDGFCVPPTADEKARVREAEQIASVRLFGLPDDRLTFLRLAENAAGELMDTPANRTSIRNYLHDLHPDLVFLPHGNDTNPDHRLAYAVFRQILQADRRPVTAFLIRDPKTIGMRIDAYTAFGACDAEWKAGLLRCHRSQHQRNLNTRGHGFDERILKVNRQIAADLRLAEPYAEAFEIQQFQVE